MTSCRHDALPPFTARAPTGYCMVDHHAPSLCPHAAVHWCRLHPALRFCTTISWAFSGMSLTMAVRTRLAQLWRHELSYCKTKH